MKRATGLARRGGPVGSWWAVVVMAALAAGACGDEFSQDLEVRFFDIDLSTIDSTVFVGESADIEATLPCTLGTCTPPPGGGIVWSSSDPQRASVDQTGLVMAGPDTGEVFIKAVFESFADSLLLRIVENGSPRLRIALMPTVRSAAPALAILNEATSVFIVHRGDAAEGLLRRLTLRGEQVWEVPTCPTGAVGPSVRAFVVVTGPNCVRAHGLNDGEQRWTLDIGADGGGAAQVRSARWLVPHVVPAPGAADSSALALSLVTSGGAEARRDTIFKSDQLDSITFTPIIAANGDALIAWSAGGVAELARVDTLGTVLAQPALPAAPMGGSVAVGPDGEILVGTPDDLVAFDSLGGPLWSANLGPGSLVSSPVVDNQGNVFVQTAVGLASYALAGGTERWRVDSLGTGSDTTSHAPVILLGDQLVAVCKDNQFLCWVEAATGDVISMAPLGGTALATPAVTIDGSVIVMVQEASQPVLAGFYGRAAPLTVAWPTEGRTMGRTRSLRP